MAKFTGRNIQTHPATSRIYVLRPSILGFLVRMPVYSGDSLVGKIGSRGFLCWDLQKEGLVNVKSMSSNDVYLTINAKAGATYYIKESPKIGFIYARASLQKMDEGKGIAVVKHLNMPKIKE